MDVSLVIPAYNEEGFIGPCLDSVLKNAPGKFKEIIVVDNASTDGTAREAAARPSVRVVYEPTKGLSHARQRGLDECSSEYVAFIDGDERMPSEWFATMEYLLKKHPKAVSLTGPVRYYDGSQLLNTVSTLVQWIALPFAHVVAGYILIGGNFVAKRQAIIDIGGFDRDISFYGEDANVGHRLALKNPTLLRMNFIIETSARRIRKEGIVRTYFVYTLNTLSQGFFLRSLSRTYTDVRT